MGELEDALALGVDEQEDPDLLEVKPPVLVLSNEAQTVTVQYVRADLFTDVLDAARMLLNGAASEGLRAQIDHAATEAAL